MSSKTKINKVTLRRNPDLKDIEQSRVLSFKELSAQEKWERLIKLIVLSRGMTKKQHRRPNKITLTKTGIIYNS